MRQRTVPRETVLATVLTLADDNGEVRDVARKIAALLEVSVNIIHLAMSYYAVRGDLIRIESGHYRIPGWVSGKIPPKPRDEYPTATACGIQPTTYFRRHITDYRVVDYAVTLARVPCLELPLPA